jgi:hypothetical protein
MQQAVTRYFYGPIVDFMLIGGLSLILYVFVLFGGLELGDFDIVWLMWVLAFFVNGPHFLISYEIFYVGHYKRLLGRPRFLWAGVVAPLLLLFAIGFGFFYQDAVVFRWLLYFMFLTVGWHYVKQSYGCFVVYAGGQGVYFKAWEQWAVKCSLFPLWWASFLNMFVKGRDSDYWGLEYSVPSFLERLQGEVYLLSVSGVCVLFFVLFRRWWVGERLPGVNAIVPVLVIYVWLSPLLSNEFFFYVIPFFHSLQYLLFSGVYTRGKVEGAGGGWRGYLVWWGGAFILGAIVFELAPSALDGLGVHGGEVTPNLFLLSFILFVNIHHYFIDNVMWRGDNEEVRQFLKMRSREAHRVHSVGPP